MVDVTASSNLYSSYLLNSFKGGVFTPETDSLKMGLTGVGYTPLKSHTQLSDITEELTGNGYSRQTLANVQIVQDGNWIRMSWDTPEFLAAGGNWSFKRFFIFDDTPVNDPLVAYGTIDVNTTDALVLVDGKRLRMIVNELGLYRLPA